MRFQTRVDPWIGIVVALAAVFTLVAPTALVASALVRGEPLEWKLLIPISLSLIVLAATLPQYYELRTEGLFIRQGWHRSLVAYDALVSAETEDSTLSAGVYSTQRIKIETSKPASYLIAPKDRSRFLSELAKHAPQIQQEPRFRLVR